MRTLELLAPARDKDIGIAAIDCGADAVYIAGPAFGARRDAGNSLEDIAGLCRYAHLFGARIMLTVNTIVYDDELASARRLMLDAQAAGVDAFIVQDLALMGLEGIHVPIHASTQCAIRDVATARWYESLGCGRLVLERQLSLSAIRQIAESVGCEIECFVHGALCVCYSGQCYMSEYIDGRSANRGECMQACRSRYDLTDSRGRTLVRNKALLSLKDLRLVERLADLADTGVDSFKIEGRLKDISYVKNIVRAYSTALDTLVAANAGKYRRASWGSVRGGFTPAEDKTFNRGYTSLYIDGKRGHWASMDTSGPTGERVGTVESVVRTGRDSMEIRLTGMADGIRLSNGDGFAFVSGRGTVGFRGDICEGAVIHAKPVEGLRRGDVLLRNVSVEFERQMAANPCRREIAVSAALRVEHSPDGGYSLTAEAGSEDGRTASLRWKTDAEAAREPGKMISALTAQFGKRHLHYSVNVSGVDVRTDGVPFIPTARLNAMRRELVEAIDVQPVRQLPMRIGRTDDSVHLNGRLTYKANLANFVSRDIVLRRGAAAADEAYELRRRRGGAAAREAGPKSRQEPVRTADAPTGKHNAAGDTVELMRSRYCIRYELGLCPGRQAACATRQPAQPEAGAVQPTASTTSIPVQRVRPAEPLYLVNNGRRFKLSFDCTACEMTLSVSQR